jgi:hypothetical protein
MTVQPCEGFAISVKNFKWIAIFVGVILAESEPSQGCLIQGNQGGEVESEWYSLAVSMGVLKGVGFAAHSVKSFL